MNAKLLVVLGTSTKREVALHLPAVLGRSREADITVPHPLISRRHCEISEKDGVLMVRDLASLNGTMIGGQRIESAPLLPDAEFTIGPLTFRVRYEFDGDLQAVPETCFVNDLEGAVDTGRGDRTSPEEEPPMLELDEALPAPPEYAGDSSDHSSGVQVTPELMALADADDEQVLSGPPAPPAQAPPGRAPPGRASQGPGSQGPASPGQVSPGRAGRSKWPPLAIDKLPTVQIEHILDEPMEFDSSLQSGSHRTESPWGTDPPAVRKPRTAPGLAARKCRPSSPKLQPTRLQPRRPGRRRRISRQARENRRRQGRRRQLRRKGPTTARKSTPSSAASSKVCNKPYFFASSLSITAVTSAASGVVLGWKRATT